MTSQKEWSLQQHKDHLAYLEGIYNKRDNPAGMAIPKREGAYYFGEGVSMAEHIERYRGVIRTLITEGGI